MGILVCIYTNMVMTNLIFINVQSLLHHGTQVIIGVYIFSVVSYYYVIEDKYFVVKKFGREIEFNYDNIEFIDFAQSEKKRQVIFYSTKGKMRFLLGDKEGKLLETLRKKCPNTLTVSEFRSKHPEERY